MSPVPHPRVRRSSTPTTSTRFEQSVFKIREEKEDEGPSSEFIPDPRSRLSGEVFILKNLTCVTERLEDRDPCGMKGKDPSTLFRSMRIPQVIRQESGFVYKCRKIIKDDGLTGKETHIGTTRNSVWQYFTDNNEMKDKEGSSVNQEQNT